MRNNKRAASEGKKAKVESETSPTHKAKRKKSLLSFGPILLVCILALALRLSFLNGCPPVESSDTKSYENQLKRDGSHQFLFFHKRAAGYPLFMKSLSYNHERIILTQRFLAGIAWLMIAIAFALKVRSIPLRWIGGISVYLLGLCATFISWDVFLLTESLSISVFLLIISCLLIWNGTNRSTRKLLALLPLIFYFSMIRPSNIYLLPGLVVYLGAMHIMPFVKNAIKRDWRRNNDWQVSIQLLLVGSITIMFFFFSHETKKAHRWVAPFENALNLRVFLHREGNQLVLNSDTIQYFAEKHQMPWRDAIRLAGKNAWAKVEPPAVAYKAWLREKGYDAYLEYLRSHPGWVLNRYFQQECSRVFLYDGRINWEWHEYKTSLKNADIQRALKIQHLFYNTVGLPLRLGYAFLCIWVLSIMLAGCWIWLQFKRIENPPSSEVIASLSILFYFAAALAFIAYFGDAVETWRHSLMGIVSYFLGGVMLFFFLADELFDRVRKHRIGVDPVVS